MVTRPADTSAIQVLLDELNPHLDAVVSGGPAFLPRHPDVAVVVCIQPDHFDLFITHSHWIVRDLLTIVLPHAALPWSQPDVALVVFRD